MKHHIVIVAFIAFLFLVYFDSYFSCFMFQLCMLCSIRLSFPLCPCQPLDVLSALIYFINNSTICTCPLLFPSMLVIQSSLLMVLLLSSLMHSNLPTVLRHASKKRVHRVLQKFEFWLNLSSCVAEMQGFKEQDSFNFLRVHHSFLSADTYSLSNSLWDIRNRKNKTFHYIQ